MSFSFTPWVVEKVSQILPLRPQEQDTFKENWSNHFRISSFNMTELFEIVKKIYFKNSMDRTLFQQNISKNINLGMLSRSERAHV